ncbi:MAG: glycosyltransferase family 2 protein [Bryobacteraceae bacterium]
MNDSTVIIAVPTLSAGPELLACVESLLTQTWSDFEIVVVDNSGRNLARRRLSCLPETILKSRLRILENSQNTGFGMAVNQSYADTSATYVATLNDDAVACTEWLAELLRAVGMSPDLGMCASQVRLLGEDCLDSAGMLICRDGSSRQRGHRAPAATFDRPEEVLLPSGSAALYRREMLDRIGGFDQDFFLYCEDTDLGLRARWAGWRCAYAPKAVVDHHYSRTAGKASALKAYYVERNRLFLVVKNFPGRALALAPLITLARYGWHALFLLRGRGSAARYRDEGNSGLSLILLVLRAHWAVAASWRTVWRKRREIQRTATLSSASFLELLHTYSIGAREVAEL